MDLFEVMLTQRAIRKFRPDPVPDELLWQVLDAAIRAPNGGNLQPWGFIVVRDPDIKARIRDLYLDGIDHVTRPSEAGERASQPPKTARPLEERLKTPSYHLAYHIEEVPALIIGTVRLSDIASTTPPGACIYPALQNLMLAARALGLGTVLTTVVRHRETELKQLLGIPEGVAVMALIPLGWPQGKFGPTKRNPPEEVTHWDRWGAVHSRPASK